MYKGTCLCGKVTIETEASPQEVHACHCGMCRKWGAGPFLSIEIPETAQLTIEPETAITRYSSSTWAERAFCRYCGTHLFYHTLGTQQYFLAADLLPSAPDQKLTSEIFIDKKPTYYHFAEPTHKMTEAEVFANFQPENH